jgi:tellurite resistance protein
VTAPALRPTLEHLPIPLLAMPMGTGGVGLAWRQAHHALGVPAVLGEALLAFTALLWVVVVALQALRALRYPEAVLAELRHPVRVAFAAAPTIGLMIVSAFFHSHVPGLGASLWAVAVALHLLVAMMLLRRIVAGRGEIAMISPPLLIPFAGLVLAPVFGVRMGFVEASSMMLGIGLILWLVTMPLLLHRLVAGPPLPPPLRPSLAILLAPPAIGALGLVALTGQTGGVVLALVGVALLFAAVLVSLAGEFARVPFGLPWWGVTFPSAAFAVMVMVMGFPALLGWAALLATTGLTGWVAWRTLGAARSGAFFRPEH